MNAQQLIDSVKDTSTNNMFLFYPEIAIQKQADQNLTKCLRR